MYLHAPLSCPSRIIWGQRAANSYAAAAATSKAQWSYKPEGTGRQVDAANNEWIYMCNSQATRSQCSVLPF